MPKTTTDGRPIPLTTRQAINWRIPFDLLARIDELRKETGQDRTAVVVAALQLYLATARVRRLVAKRRGTPPAPHRTRRATPRGSR